MNAESRRVTDPLLEFYLVESLDAEARAQVEAVLAESAADRKRLQELRAESAAFLVQHPPGPLVERFEASQLRWWRSPLMLLVPVLASVVLMVLLLGSEADKAHANALEALRQQQAADAHAQEARKQLEAADAHAREALRQQQAADAHAQEARKQLEAADVHAREALRQKKNFVALLARASARPEALHKLEALDANVRDALRQKEAAEANFRDALRRSALALVASDLLAARQQLWEANKNALETCRQQGTFSPHGSRLFTASNDGTARIWRVDDQPLPLILRYGPEEDTDKDGIPNWVDTCAHEPGLENNLGCPEHEVPPVAITARQLELRDNKIHFVASLAHIQERSFVVLDWVAKVMREHPELPRLRVGVHMDTRHFADQNRQLSQQRAEEVRRYLIGKGVAAERLEAQGYGSDRPIASNATSIGRENNRRVDFSFICDSETGP
ncbi:MAG TPA: OmpA family protein [Archangium sp.]|nr:OmpA family protein [Archangium sp.]